ncbi:carbonic anhydrase [Paramixta manurensis]|uniref:Carbonic anhydrase n=1 Tax=Paramixta manurensis TaxID=2740817 RepID=A0A6M8UAA6_9GAMM|nr:carbonic anhydrase [Erwiniaceae bacterium PD-1]
MKAKNLVAVVLSLFAPFTLAKPSTHWSYEGQGSPEHWGDLNASWEMCKNGQFQSPIDIRQPVNGNLPALEINLHTKSQSIVNNGHTVQIVVDDDDDFMLDNQAYHLKQFHFHTPSENRIEGQTFPLEAHFVHANQNGELAVVAVMFTEGAENPAITAILNNLPAKLNDVKALQKPLNLSALFPADKHYYRYSGSLTTPPCSEGVTWLVMRNNVTLSPSQLSMFVNALKHANNRPLQPLHGRIIVE